MLSRLGIAFMRLLAFLPLPAVRFLGVVLGWLLYGFVSSRRKVARTNLSVCFANWSLTQRQQVLRQVFVSFAQAWLDRGWIWHGNPALIRQRIQITGAIHALNTDEPLVIFAPHFVGLDAGWTALTLMVERKFHTIYTDQSNQALDAWIYAGRKRFGQANLWGRIDGVKPILSALRRSEVLYLLPDMNFGAQESVFVPFFGVQAATVPSLSRFARLGRAKVVPVTTSLTKQGYLVQVHEPWQNFPTADPISDTQRMNAELEILIQSMPEQYYWVHKRFKDRPLGERSFYE